MRIPGDRYLAPARALAGADIVHSQELGYWYSMQAARLRRRLGFRLVLTVWETLPFLDAYRNARTRAYRHTTLAGADMFLAMTDRARECLLLEGADPARVRVCPPGIATERFAGAAQVQSAPGRTILSPGRLVWEKGHQDVIRAFAALRQGIGISASEAARSARLLIVGSGPEEPRLLAYASELGLGQAVEIRSVPYEEMPALFARASAMVLASLPLAGDSYHPLGVPRVFWEEQFGMVLAEAMSAGLTIVATTSGARSDSIGCPRSRLTLKPAPSKPFAAVAPSSTSTSGLTTRSSSSSHGRHAWISKRLGVLCSRRLPRSSNLKCFTTFVR